MTLKSGFR
jgi:hypothetical protein